MNQGGNRPGAGRKPAPIKTKTKQVLGVPIEPNSSKLRTSQTRQLTLILY